MHDSLKVLGISDTSQSAVLNANLIYHFTLVTDLSFLQANFSGIVVENMPEEVDTTRIHDKSFVEYFGDVSFFSQEQGDPENPDIRYLWNLATFLPQPCEEIFKEIVTGYISQASVQYQDYFRKINRGEIVPRRQFEDEDKEAEVSEPVENLRDLVRGWITQTMLA